jgi:hypothetical protein
MIARVVAPLIALALACGCPNGSKPGDAVPPARVPTLAPPPLPPIVSDDATRAAALKGELPPGPDAALLGTRCTICHTTQYLTQQRLTEAQWQKTIGKMKKWGAPIEDTDITRLAKYLGTHFPVDLPEPPPRTVAR